MKLKVKRTARKTITKLVSKPLISELTVNQEEVDKAGSGGNSDFSENASESSPSEKAKDVAHSSTTSGSNFSWKKEFVVYKEETSDSGQSDSAKPRFLRSGPTVKDDAITVSSGSLFSEDDDFQLNKEITVQAGEPHVESSASNASSISTPFKITSDGSEGENKQEHGRHPKITLKSSDLEIPSSSDSQLQKKENLRKLIESKEEKRASTSIQEVPKVSKRGRGRPPKVNSKNSELEKSVGSKEGKNAPIQKVSQSLKRGRGRPRKQSSVDYSNKTVNEILPSSESANFAPLEKNVSIVLPRLTNAELKKYNVEDQLKVCLNQGMIGKKSNINGVSHDRNLTVTNPTEESELSVVSDTEIQNTNLEKENLKENVEKWLQTVVIDHCVDNLEENMNDQSVVKDAVTITQSVADPERRKTPKELNNRKRKIISEPTLDDLIPSKNVVPNEENSVDLFSKESDPTKKLERIEKRGRKRKILPADPVAGCQNSVISSVERSTSKHSVSKGLCSKPVKNKSDKDNTSGCRSRASSRVIPPALSEDLKKLYCNVEMPDTTHTNITVGTLYDMYDIAPVVRINRIEPNYLEHLLSVL